MDSLKKIGRVGTLAGVTALAGGTALVGTTLTAATLVGTALLYTAFRSKDGRTNDYFKAQDLNRKLTKRTAPPQALDDMMFSKGTHTGKGKPLVYGLEDESREPLRDRYHMPPGFEKRVILPLSIATEGPYTADHYNNVTWRGFAEQGRRPNQSIFNKNTMKELTSRPKAKDVKSKLDNWRASLPGKYKTPEHDNFFESLMAHPRYSPTSTAKEDDKAVIKREGESDGAKAKFQSQTRRSSKFGLEHQRKNNENVAFMLDYPNFGTAPQNYNFQINKTKTGNRAGGLKSSDRVPITTSEMRKAYRDKDEPGTQPTFFVGGNKVHAPWTSHQDSWNKYGSYRLDKYSKAWSKESKKQLRKHTNSDSYRSLASDNEKANYLKQKWLGSNHQIPRKDQKK